MCWSELYNWSIGEVPADMDVAVNTFEDPNASAVHLEHELLADRLHALLHQASTRVWNSDASNGSRFTTRAAGCAEDIMILINSKRLPGYGRPIAPLATSPLWPVRQGLLLMQPVVQPLVAVLALMARPTMRKAGVVLARSPVVGMTEGEVHQAFTTLDADVAVFPHHRQRPFPIRR